MSTLKIEDIRFSSSAIDDFFTDARPARMSSSKRFRIAGLQHLAGFEVISDDKLIRVSQKDFWKLGQDSEGYFIERLVDDDSGPIKE